MNKQTKRLLTLFVWWLSFVWISWGCSCHWPTFHKGMKMTRDEQAQGGYWCNTSRDNSVILTVYLYTDRDNDFPYFNLSPVMLSEHKVRHAQHIDQQHTAAQRGAALGSSGLLQGSSLYGKMSFDNALAVAGGFGKFQLWLIFLTIPARATLPLNYLLNNFIGVVPSHHCNVDSLDDGGAFGNLSQEEKLRVSIPVGQGGMPDSCVMFAEPQYHLLLQNSSNATGLPTVSCQRGWVYDNPLRNSLVTEVNLTSFIVSWLDTKTNLC